jgi:hypothetical protein
MMSSVTWEQRHLGAAWGKVIENFVNVLCCLGGNVDTVVALKLRIANRRTEEFDSVIALGKPLKRSGAAVLVEDQALAVVDNKVN